MDKMPIKETMISLLYSYQQLIMKQLTKHGLVGEYLNRPIEPNTRLLCQMRTILFLVKTDKLFPNNGHIELAENLLAETDIQYLKDGIWFQQLNKQHEANLYTYSFIILAIGYLYKATQNTFYSIALNDIFKNMDKTLNELTIFKPLELNADYLEQNSAMHLFESLTFAYYQANAKYMKDRIDALQEELLHYFWQPNDYLLAEKISPTGEVLTYEAGHWFEWVTLLHRIETWGGKAFADSKQLFWSAMENTDFSAERFILNEMDNKIDAIAGQKNRIWPNLEYLRAKTLIEKRIPQKELENFIATFFDDNGLPKEYLQEDTKTIKSTTGYHIAESFIDILTFQNQQAQLKKPLLRSDYELS